MSAAPDTWLLLQLADSAFPTGGFAHSSGLEAAVQLGEVQGGAGLDRFVGGSVWQAGFGALPFASAAHQSPDEHARIDATCDAFLTGAVANRASRTQGRAFVATCARIFPLDRLVSLDATTREGAHLSHFAPAFGVALRALEIPRRSALALYLHLALRGVTSAAVRLGVVGPHEAQRIQRARAPTLEAVLEACAELTLEEIAQPSPILELMGATQDRLYSRLFQS